MEVKNMFQSHNINQAERVPIIKKWLGRQGLQLLETLTQAEHDACHSKDCLFKMLNEKSSHSTMTQ